MLPRLSLDLLGTMVSFGNRGSEIPIGWRHDESRVRLWCACDHIDDILVSWRIDDDEIPAVSEKLLRVASGDHAWLLLLLLPVHVRGQTRRMISEVVPFLVSTCHAHVQGYHPARRGGVRWWFSCHCRHVHK